jgi:hypothetical protein
MAISTPSATVIHSNTSGSTLLWTDTGTYGTITSRTLVISDAFGNVLQTVSLGVVLTYTYTITYDAFYKFVHTVVDSNGTWTYEVDWVAYGFYAAQYLSQVSASITNGGYSIETNNYLDIAERFYSAAIRMNIAGNFITANNLIQAANYYANLQI